MIDFNKLDSEFQALVPIRAGIFQYNRKRYSLSDESINGWYDVTLKGNECLSCTPSYSSMLFFDQKQLIRGYTYNNLLIFQNFDVAKRKCNKDVSAELNFNNSETFSSIIAVLWEDKRFYYVEPNYADIFIYTIKVAYENSESIAGIKGITPELKMLYLFHAIERENMKKLLEEAEQKQKEEEFKKTIPGRLAYSFSQVGGVLTNYSISGSRILVDWELKDSLQKFNSVLDANTFRVIEAGYCMTGHDKEHSVSSLVLTAKDYDEDGLIHITRRR